jgi:hypothetical protein
MRTLRCILIVLLAALLCTACGKKNKRPDSKLVTEKDPARGFLATIPADTPYAFIAAEPMPLGPVMGLMEQYSGYVQQATGNFGTVLQDEYVDAETKALVALLKEFSDHYSREGIQELGFSLSPRFAFYGIGVLPALKMDLGDVDKFKAMLDRIEQKSGLRRTTETVGDTEFWTYPFEDGFLAMSLIDGQLVAGFTPQTAASLFVEVLVGERLPETPMSDVDTIPNIAKQYGFAKFGAGFVDFERFAQMMLEPEPGLNDEILRALDTRFPEATPTCLEETQEMLAKAPRAVFGYEKLDETGAVFAAGIETKNDVGQKLTEAMTSAPLAGSQMWKDAPLLIAFGFDVGKVVSLVQSKASAIQADPYQCEWYREFNGAAQEVATASQVFVPAMVTNLRGGTVAVLDVKPNRTSSGQSPPSGSTNPTTQPYGSTPTPNVKVEGAAVVNSVDPMTLFAWLRSFVPEYASLTAKTDGAPVALPATKNLSFLDMPHVVMTKQSLAVASGDGVPGETSQALAATSPGDSPFFMIAYDLAEIGEMFADQAAMNGLDTTMLMKGRTSLEIAPRDDAVFIRASVPFDNVK